ncbi:hypothetical protein ACFPVX_07055 [Cohnella faecalis]|uniref:Uncharacterized protein n=1 Tax=Cohnella faecalis TaxID=2315694 RepID=A0A398CFN4_9BACL|nr:hypothetical protein [Cohnella faecalis]RIE00712.1 hypothetical protein D3H35_26300 [Cohnella faecalis]
MNADQLKKGQYIYLTRRAIQYLNVKKAATGASLSALIESMIEADMSSNPNMQAGISSLFGQSTEQQ